MNILKRLTSKANFTKRLRKFSTIEENQLKLKFDYGQDSILRIQAPKRKIKADVETLWVDHTEVELALKDNKINDYDIKEEGKEIFLRLKEPNFMENDVRKMKLKVPEYSSLDFECRGEVIQHDTNIDAKLKGTLRIVSDDTDPESIFQFRRVKTEVGEIRVKNSDIIFTSYWETRTGILQKLNKGKIEMKRFGVSEFFEADLKDCFMDIKTTFANPVEENKDKVKHRILLKGENTNISFGIFRGSINAKLENSVFKINEGNFDGLKINGKESHIELYFNEINAPCEMEFEGCEVVLKVSPLIKEKFEDENWVKVKENGSRVQVVYEEFQSNLFGYLMSKYNVNRGNK